MIFMEIEHLTKFEKDKNWKEAICLLNDMWNKDRNNVNVLLRLSTECWYVMSNWHLLNLDNSELNFDTLQSILIKTYNYFKEYFNDSNKCISIFGYMMSLFPNYFYTDEDINGKIFLKYENLGKNMLKSAYRNEPQNKLYKALYLSSANASDKMIKTSKSELKPILQELFPNNTEIEEYFKEMLTE